MDADLITRADEVLRAFRIHKATIAAVESCTGGLVMAALTAVAGSSDVVDRGFVTYTNDAKSALVGVAPSILQAHGAVSREVAAAMAEGGLMRSDATICVSVTGIAGPGGATDTKPVGLVFVGCARRDGETIIRRSVFQGDRASVRAQSVHCAFDMAIAALERGQA